MNFNYVLFISIFIMVGCFSKGSDVTEQRIPDFRQSFNFPHNQHDIILKELKKTSFNNAFHLILPSSKIIVNSQEKFIVALREKVERGPYCLTIDNIIEHDVLVIKVYQKNCERVDDLIKVKEHILKILQN